MAKSYFKQNCHACHTRFAVFFPLPFCCVSSLLFSGTGNGDKSNSDSGNEIGTVAHPLYPNSESHITLASVKSNKLLMRITEMFTKDKCFRLPSKFSILILLEILGEQCEEYLS